MKDKKRCCASSANANICDMATDCNGCIFHKSETLEPCEDCISRKAVTDLIRKEWVKYVPMELDMSISFVLGKIDELPPVTPAEKTRHWIYSKAVNTGEIIFSECSACGHGESRCAKRMNYCPNCGAKMQEGE